MPCECTFVQNITLAPGATWISATATIFVSRADQTDYGARGQELPATYSIGDLHNLKSYTGAAPWTNGPISDIPTPSPQPPWVPGIFTGTENWAALLNDGDWGFGVYSPRFNQFNAGFHGAAGGGPTDDNTGYIAPYAQVDLTYDARYSFDFSIVLGNLATIRSFAYQQHAAAAAGGRAYADFSDESSRLEWDVRVGTRGRSASGLALRSGRLGAAARARVVVAGPPMSWHASDGGYVDVIHSSAGEPCGRTVMLSVYFLRAGQPVYAADDGAFRYESLGAKSSAAVRSAFSEEQAVSTLFPLQCSLQSPALARLHVGALGAYAGPLVQMQLVAEAADSAAADFALTVHSIRVVRT